MLQKRVGVGSLIEGYETRPFTVDATLVIAAPAMATFGALKEARRRLIG